MPTKKELEEKIIELNEKIDYLSIGFLLYRNRSYERGDVKKTASEYDVLVEFASKHTDIRGTPKEIFKKLNKLADKLHKRPPKKKTRTR
jgi:predicted nucleotidyltransferase